MRRTPTIHPHKLAPYGTDAVEAPDGQAERRMEARRIGQQETSRQFETEVQEEMERLEGEIQREFLEKMKDEKENMRQKANHSEAGVESYERSMKPHENGYNDLVKYAQNLKRQSETEVVLQKDEDISKGAPVQPVSFESEGSDARSSARMGKGRNQIHSQQMDSGLERRRASEYRRPPRNGGHGEDEDYIVKKKLQQEYANILMKQIEEKKALERRMASLRLASGGDSPTSGRVHTPEPKTTARRRLIQVQMND